MEQLLTVYQFDKKLRLGSNCDGGYVIGDLDIIYDCYISAGISNEESFSRDFINKYNMNKENCFGFDGTITDYPYHYTNKITFFKKNIGGVNSENISNLTEFTSQFNNIFLKIDIEGGEYPWLLNLDESHLTKFKQIVIEFHGINDNSWSATYDDKIKCLTKLHNTHYLIHAHGNNHSSIKNNIPDVIELTYVNKKYFDSPPKLNQTPLPIQDLDFPNRSGSSDYDLNCVPFVYKNE